MLDLCKIIRKWFSRWQHQICPRAGCVVCISTTAGIIFITILLSTRPLALPTLLNSAPLYQTPAHCNAPFASVHISQELSDYPVPSCGSPEGSIDLQRQPCWSLSEKSWVELSQQSLPIFSPLVRRDPRRKQYIYIYIYICVSDTMTYCHKLEQFIAEANQKMAVGHNQQTLMFYAYTCIYTYAK